MSAHAARRSGGPVSGAFAAAVTVTAFVATAASCGSAAVTGTAVAATVVAPAGVPVARLLDTSVFPAEYPAVVLDEAAVAQAGPDLWGVRHGDRVAPPGCLPPPHDPSPAVTAMAVGTSEDRTTLTVELVADPTRLALTREFADRCGEVVATGSGVAQRVRTTVVDADPVPGSDAVDVVRTIGPVDGGAPGLVRSEYSRVVQAGDVHVVVTHMGYGSAGYGDADVGGASAGRSDPSTAARRENVRRVVADTTATLSARWDG